MAHNNMFRMEGASLISKIEYVIKHSVLIQKIYVFVFSAIFRVIGIFVRKNNEAILFQSLIGKNYGDSPKVLYDAIRKDDAFKGYSFYWAFDDPDSFEVDNAQKIKLNSIKYFITALKTRVWITNVNIERGLHFKPKGTIYLNTWHGCAPLKVDGNAQKNRNDYDFSDVDIFCSNSEWQDEIFVKYYRAKKESIIRCGMPRNDALYKVDLQEIEGLRKRFGIPEGKKVILYAPTWRESSNIGNDRVIKPPIDIRHWEEELAEEYVILFRMHHLTTKVMNIEYNSFVRDCSGPMYDINDLMKMADILITDYSSTLTDFAILERPVLFFAYDYEEYYKTRGLYMRLEELLPGCVCLDENELLDHIIHLDYMLVSEKVKKLKNKYVCGGEHSTEICISEIKNKLGINDGGKK